MRMAEILGTVALLLMGSATFAIDRAVPTGVGEDGKLAAFFQAYLDQAFRDEPLMATRLGDHRFDDALDDLSSEARAAHLERDRKALADLPRQVAFDKLS